MSWDRDRNGHHTPRNPGREAGRDSGRALDPDRGHDAGRLTGNSSGHHDTSGSGSRDGFGASSDAVGTGLGTGAGYSSNSDSAFSNTGQGVSSSSLGHSDAFGNPIDSTFGSHAPQDAHMQTHMAQSITGDPKDGVKALLFDVFGTVVDWRSSVTRELQAFGRARGIDANWQQFADDWRGLYQPSMEEVRTGRRPFVILDELHRENLSTLLERYRLPQLTDADVMHLVRAWHRLDPWPDVVEGLYRLKRSYIIGTLSNGNIGLMVRLAKHNGLPWDVILGAEVTQAYKPTPEAYTRSAGALNLATHEVMLVAAHNSDLRAAERQGLRTAFVTRPTEHGGHQTQDLTAEAPWDVVATDFNGVADALNCPRYG